MKLITFLLVLFSTPFLFAQNSWYVSPSGTNATGHGTSATDCFATVTYASTVMAAGDTCFVRGGTYSNASYPTKLYYNSESTVKISNLTGSNNQWFTFKPYQNEQPVFKGNGRQIFQVRTSSYVRVEGFEIYGEVENIPVDTAQWWQFAYRLTGTTETLWREDRDRPISEIETETYPILSNFERPDYFNTKGLLVQASSHIELIENNVHHMPGTGLRAQDCAYVDVIGNEVSHCSRRSAVGTHGLVFDSTNSETTGNGIKCRIEKNEVHHNYNEVYSWNGGKTFIVPHIDEGKGISMQRNDTEHGWTHGWFNIENNVCYRNGFSGIHSNYGERFRIINNTCYRNGYSQKGKNIGISLSNTDDVIIRNNISWADTEWNGFAISMDANSADVVVKNNLIFGLLDPDIDLIDVNTENQNPLFTDAENFDFTLTENSYAIGKATTSAPIDDKNGNIRDANPDYGALERIVVLPVDLLTFSGKTIHTNTNELTWKTISEFNNDYFTLEKSTDGRTWEFLEKVNGADNSEELSEYRFVDKEPRNGNNYYRLSQTDFDGKTTFFNLVLLNNDNNNLTENAYPNPFTRTLFVKQAKSNVRVFDVLGRDVSGQVDFSITEDNVRLDFGNMKSGVYFVQIGEKVQRVYKL